jgi:hypothetical protein
MAAVIVAASGILGATGQPLYAAVGDATLQWATVKSEREKLRRRVTGVLMAVANHLAERRDSAQAGPFGTDKYRNAKDSDTEPIVSATLALRVRLMTITLRGAGEAGQFQAARAAEPTT